MMQVTADLQLSLDKRAGPPHTKAVLCSYCAALEPVTDAAFVFRALEEECGLGLCAAAVQD